MINELKVLSDSIKNAGFSSTDWENKFGEIKLASPCFSHSRESESFADMDWRKQRRMFSRIQLPTVFLLCFREGQGEKTISQAKE